MVKSKYTGDRKKSKFATKTAAEIAKETAMDKELNDRALATAEIGRELLSDERFIEYLEKIKELREYGITKLCENTIADPVQRLAFQDAWLAKISGVSLLIPVIEDLTKKEIKLS